MPNPKEIYPGQIFREYPGWKDFIDRKIETVPYEELMTFIRRKLGDPHSSLPTHDFGETWPGAAAWAVEQGKLLNQAIRILEEKGGKIIRHTGKPKPSLTSNLFGVVHGTEVEFHRKTT